MELNMNIDYFGDFIDNSKKALDSAREWQSILESSTENQIHDIIGSMKKSLSNNRIGLEFALKALNIKF